MKISTIPLALGAIAVQADPALGGMNLAHPNHIFNAIHSSMRQWGSSLNHNGMTAFIATVPRDTELYHGTRTDDRINGTEWLAFEPEHALLFAESHGRPPPEGRPPEGRSSEGRPLSLLSRLIKAMRDLVSVHDMDQCLQATPRECSWRPRGHPSAQAPMRDPHSIGGPQSVGAWRQAPPETKHSETKHSETKHSGLKHSGLKQSRPEQSKPGFLHTYRTNGPLRLLYVDGQSAAKSQKGTLDLQDVVILQSNFSSSAASDSAPSPPRGGPMHERERAEGLCRMAREQWQGRIDGVLRMEGGFEVILCSFERHLDVVSIKQTASGEMDPPPERGGRGRGASAAGRMDYYKAVAARYDGIGGNRVSVEDTDFVSLFAYPGALYFDETGHPRAHDESEALAGVRAAITEMVLRDDVEQAVSWQAVADMVVARHSDRVEYLASGELRAVDELHREIELALRPFIDYRERKTEDEIERCANQFMPSTDAEELPVAGAAIKNVSSTICTTLVRALGSHSASDIVESAQGLKSWLGWTGWKRCRGCQSNEVCFLPIWPVGSMADFVRPQCRSRASLDEEPGDYWRDT